LPRSDGASAHRPWPDGRSAYSLAMSLKCVMDVWIEKTLTRERRPRKLRRCNCECNDRSSARERSQRQGDRTDDRAQRSNGASAVHT
jgi:hypothetical protein